MYYGTVGNMKHFCKKRSRCQQQAGLLVLSRARCSNMNAKSRAVSRPLTLVPFAQMSKPPKDKQYVTGQRRQWDLESRVFEP